MRSSTDAQIRSGKTVRRYRNTTSLRRNSGAGAVSDRAIYQETAPAISYSSNAARGGFQAEFLKVLHLVIIQRYNLFRRDDLGRGAARNERRGL